MIAEYERAKILERSRRGKRHAARRGWVSVLSGAVCDRLGHSAMSVTERYLDPTKIPTIRVADVLPTPVIIQPNPGTDAA